MSCLNRLTGRRPPLWCLPVLAIVCVGSAPLASAAGPSVDDAAVLAGACVNCHGTGAGAPIPDLRGMPEAHLRSRLLAFHEGKAADATVMTRLMKGYDRAQIEALVKWFAAEGGR